MNYTISGKSFSAIVTVEENTVKSTDNECISILVGKNWGHVEKKCKEWGWTVEEIPEINVSTLDDVVICHTPTTIEACWPFPKEWITTDI